MITYPRSLIPILRRKWRAYQKRPLERIPDLPSRAVLEMLIDVAFHASFLTEEKRRPGYRIIYYSPEDYGEDIKFPPFYKGSRLLRLDTIVPFTSSEVNRLAPAAELTRLILCVTNTSEDPKKPDLHIWAMLDVGENWWKFIRHESTSGYAPPGRLTITSSSPGALSFSTQGRVLFTLNGGQVFYPTVNPFSHGPVSEFLDSAKHKLYEDVINSLNTSVWDPEGHDDDYPYRFYNYFLERILFNIWDKQHGGTIIIVPSCLTKNDTRLTDRLNIKYPCSYDHAWEILVHSLVNEIKYYGLYFKLSDGKEKLTQTLFNEHTSHKMEREELDEQLGDAAKAIASMTSVDGAVIMNDRMSILGFGAEVIAQSPSLRDIVVVTRPTNRLVPMASYGTRHRAAFRFCSTFEDAVAFVVSSDGRLKAVKRDGGNVFLWPDIDTGSLGL